MRRAPVPAVLAALAVLAAALPLRRLFTEPTFLRPATVAVGVILLVGLLLRPVTGRMWPVLLAQLLALGETLAVLFAGSTLWYGLPTVQTGQRLAELLVQARDTIAEHAAPAPVDDGVALGLTLLVALIALTADLAAATADSPTSAGLPVISLYAVSAANAPQGLPWYDFVLPAVLWLLLLARQSREQLRRWVSHELGGKGSRRRPDAGRDAAGGALTRQGAVLAVLGLAAALVAPALLPHMPATQLGRGLGPGDGTDGAVRSPVSLSSEIDLRRNLEDPDPSPVLTYRTDDTSPPPLRVGVAVTFDEGRARIRTDGTQVAIGDPGTLDVLRTSGETYTTTVEESRIEAPQLPTPFAATDVRVPSSWSLDADGVVRVADDAAGYSVTYAPALSETEAVTAAAGDGTAGLDDPATYLQVDPAVADELQTLDARIVDPGATPLEAAQSIQSYLRGSDFTYDLELAPRGAGEHPISHFLRTRRGYCQQFAAAMVHLARAQGIPARFVVGFLPGTPTGEDGQRVVRAANAHAWPELYISGVGWLRFEPTPGARAADVPGYSIPDRVDDTASSSTTSTSSSAPTASSTSSAPTEVPTQTGGSTALRPILWLLAALALLAVLPLTALLLREAARRSSRPPVERVERDWDRLLTELSDLGVGIPPGATPREAGRHLQQAGVGVRSDDRVSRVVATVERARYAPEQQAPDRADAERMTDDVDAIVDRVQRTRSSGQRLGAVLAPASARRWWGEMPGRLVRSLTRR